MCISCTVFKTEYCIIMHLWKLTGPIYTSMFITLKRPGYVGSMLHSQNSSFDVKVTKCCPCTGEFSCIEFVYREVPWLRGIIQNPKGQEPYIIEGEMFSSISTLHFFWLLCGLCIALISEFPELITGLLRINPGSMRAWERKTNHFSVCERKCGS